MTSAVRHTSNLRYTKYAVASDRGVHYKASWLYWEIDWESKKD